MSWSCQFSSCVAAAINLPASMRTPSQCQPFLQTTSSKLLRCLESPQRCFMAHNVHSSHEVRRRKGTLVQPSSPTSPIESEAHAHVQAQQLTWPPPEHRSRAPEFYGFVAWTSTYLLFVIYLLWAFLPDELIIWLGVTWYPNR